MKSLFIYISVAAIMLISCKDQYNICDTPRTVELNAGFYQMVGAVPTTITAPSLTINLLNASVFLYNQQTGLQKFAIQLNPQTDTAKYFIRMGTNLPADTITFIYNSFRQNLPEPCGFIYTNTLISAGTTYHTLDSIKITNTAVGTDGIQNVRLFF